MEKIRVLFIITNASLGTWLAEVLRPYWHLSERASEIEFASTVGGKIVWDRLSDLFSEGSFEANDLVSKGFLSDKALVARLESTIPLSNVRPEDYDAVHVAGGTGAADDLFPNSQMERILEHIWCSG